MLYNRQKFIMKKILSILSIASLLMIGCKETDDFRLSPYKNFMDDAANYRGLTTTLSHPYFGNAAIDNIIISNELFNSYLDNSAEYEYSATQTIPNYRTTTSTHYPVSVTFRVTEELSIVDVQQTPYFQVYPNPTTSIVHIKTENEIATIEDIKVF